MIILTVVRLNTPLASLVSFLEDRKELSVKREANGGWEVGRRVILPLNDRNIKVWIGD